MTMTTAAAASFSIISPPYLLLLLTVVLCMCDVSWSFSPREVVRFEPTTTTTTLASTTNRREVIKDSLGWMSVTAAILGVSPPFIETASAGGNDSLVSLLGRLRQVPTFCIVTPEGIPYMLINRNERIAKGYAFTTLRGAQDVLDDAQRASLSGGYWDVWRDAMVITLPMDIAMRLALQKAERRTPKGQTLDTIYDIIPSSMDREDAIAIAPSFSGAQGKVPLFYLEGLQLQSSTSTGTPSSPLYFRKSDLLREWGNQNPGKAFPPDSSIKILDLSESFLATLRGRSAFPENAVFVPYAEEVQSAKELKSNGMPAYKVDQMIL